VTGFDPAEKKDEDIIYLKQYTIPEHGMPSGSEPPGAKVAPTPKCDCRIRTRSFLLHTECVPQKKKEAVDNSRKMLKTVGSST
jgi:hypothetical protein